jgi:NAD(P)-dependent dehydrogenase (short-subunit alcohol dehydrogenase family)
MAVAIVTGASKGLGRALANGLAERGWSLVVDARGESALTRAGDEIRARLSAGAQVRAIPGDVTDAAHRRALAAAAVELGRLDLVVNNASTLGASPLPLVADLSPDTLRRVVEVNTVAPLALVSETLPLLRQSPDPRILNITSDASVEHYPSWGGYGASKAALDHLSATLAEEESGIRVWAVDPGDMRTEMHQAAFPGQDISDRPDPDTVVPSLIALITGETPSGRITLAELAAVAEVGR